MGLSPVLLEQFMEWKSPLHLNQLPLLSWAQVFSVYSTDLNVCVWCLVIACACTHTYMHVCIMCKYVCMWCCVSAYIYLNIHVPMKRRDYEYHSGGLIRSFPAKLWMVFDLSNV